MKTFYPQSRNMEYANKMLEKYSETPDQKHEFYQLVEKKAKEMKNRS